MPTVYTDHFDDGIPFPAIARAIYADYDGNGARWPDPANTAQAGCFRDWLNEPADADGPGRVLITRLAAEIYRRQADLRAEFADPMGRDRSRFAVWFVQVGGRELGLADCFLAPVRAALQQLAKVEGAPWWRLSDEAGGGALSSAGGSGVEARPGALPFLPKPMDLPPDGDAAPAKAPGTPVPAAARRPKGRPLAQGANIIGYLRSESGIGEMCRAMMRTLLRQNYPVACTTLDRHDGARQADDSLRNWPLGHPFAINLLHVNADAVRVVFSDLGPQFFAGTYNIGYWFWELSRFPADWNDRFSYLDEVWVASSFVQTAVAAASPIPVVRIRPCLDVTAGPVSRQELGLPEDAFTFLYIFDILNGCERKNPLGLIEAYRRAFPSQSRQTALVLKINNLDKSPEQRQRLLRAAERVKAIIIDRYMPRPELNSLINACDAYVSLHRAEGFGLTIAEAMWLGKPVIATAYSGNMDFMTPSNSHAVGFRLVELDQDYPPYQHGSVWAEPDLDHAASLMRRVYEQRDQAAAMGAQAASDVRRMYGIEEAGPEALRRLNLISQMSARRQTGAGQPGTG